MPTSFTLNGQPLTYGPFKDANDVSHPANVLDVWSDEDLSAIGVVRTIEPDPTPSPSRPLIAKSVIQERVNAIGKLGDAFAVLNSQPILFGRWFAPDWPNVYFDDPDMLALLNAIGCTPEQIEQITAP